MVKDNNTFFTRLSKIKTKTIPLYCTGYPELSFIKNYCETYNILPKKDDFILKDKNYSIIKQMGFDAISIWDFRRSSGGYNLNNEQFVDGWGRVYRRNWYTWNGVFKTKGIVKNWSYLTIPSRENLHLLRNAMNQFNKLDLIPVFSLPGLFEKTWQSMGFLFFSKCLRHQNYDLIETIIEFFHNYTIDLVKILRQYRARFFLIADDMGYKNRLFINELIWKKLFFDKYQELVQEIHKQKNNSNFIILHSDGYITNLMDKFIQLGFDGIQSLEPDAGVNIFDLMVKYTDKITFIGNVSNTMLSYGTPFDVKHYVSKLIDHARKYNVRLIISPTQQIDAYIKVENVKTMIDTTKQFHTL